jgi:glycosyltransferase involved in cell wall biosynthesis
MKLIVVASWYPDARHPVRGSFIREQALALVNLGHDVHVVHFDRTVRPALLSVSSSQRDGLSEHGICVPFPLHRVLGFYWPGVLARRLRGLIDEIRPEIVHAHAARPAGVVASLAVSGNGPPLVLTEHKGNVERYWRTMHGKRQVEQAYGRCDRLYAVSKTFIADLERVFPATTGRWQLSHNGIDTDRFTIAPGRRVPFAGHDVRLLFLGGTAFNKGLDVFLKALAGLPQKYRATVGGPGTDPRNRRRIVPPALRDRVQLIGSAPRDAIPGLMNSHDALVVASRYETFSLVSAEALACGTPVVASRCGGPEEVVGDYGELFDAGRPAAMAAALRRTQDRAGNWDPASAREHVLRSFSMTGLATGLVDDYWEVVRARTGFR